MAQLTQSAVRNRLLTGLPLDAFELLAPSLEPVALSFKEVLYDADEPIGFIYFIETGMVSMLALLEAGDLLEVGVVGPEGLVGMPVVFGADRSSTQAMVQMAGTALRVRAPVIRQAFNGSEALRNLLMRYMQALHAQVTQTAACNGRHTLEERLARWILIAHDRAGDDCFPMTHEFMSMMLGVRRSGVSIAAGILKKSGVINYGNGDMVVLDRPGLEAAACECYGAVRHHFEQLLGISRG
jgi:CRP-like cAMP-binding protein